MNSTAPATETTENKANGATFVHRYDPESEYPADAFSRTVSETTGVLYTLAAQFEGDNKTTLSNSAIAQTIYSAISGINDLEAIFHVSEEDFNQSQSSDNQTAFQPTSEIDRQIRCRDDLSFTKRDAEGRLTNWFVPGRDGNYHEHYGIGEIWFSEIVELARHDPEEAYYAMKFAGPELVRYSNYGHPEGFFDQMARWAIAGIMANSEYPEMPFKTSSMGSAPIEGMDYYINRTVSEEKSITIHLPDNGTVKRMHLKLEAPIISALGERYLVTIDGDNILIGPLEMDCQIMNEKKWIKYMPQERGYVIGRKLAEKAA